MSSRVGKDRSAASSSQVRSDRYWAISSNPLHAFVLLAPLVIAYEVGSALYLTNPESGTRRGIEAEKLLGDFFQIFGLAGLILPGIALLAVLLVWQIIEGGSWRVRPGVLVAMSVESAAWTIPLVVLSAIVSSPLVSWHVLQAGAEGLTELSWQARLTISIGAGLYEEMLFRLVGIALLHFILADLMQIGERLATGIAVVLAGLAFALYHDVVISAAGVNWGNLVFYTAAGIYLGVIFVTRGFGIAVATHVLYDVLVLVLLPSVERSGGA